jgi:hypothetical protein
VKTFFIISVTVIIGLSAARPIAAQDKADNSSKSAKTAEDRSKQQFWRERKAKKEKDAALKAHMKHQTKEVRKRMKKDKKKADEYNSSGY